MAERIIKKYANRRLYDATVSRHVTLQDIRALIVQGEAIRVVEDKTGEDITRLILLQVIAEQEQQGRPMLSTALLESIIRFYGSAMQDFMARYLEASVETFKRQQDALREQIARVMSDAPMASMAGVVRQNVELFARMQENLIASIGKDGERAEEPARRNGEGE